jgi:hypothetical protein
MCVCVWLISNLTLFSELVLQNAMQFPSLSLILSGIFISYIGYSVWTLAQLFVPPKCHVGEKCLISFLHNRPNLQVSWVDVLSQL